MKSYEKQLEEFGREIADEVITKEKNYKYVIYLDRIKISKSLSTIHNKDLSETIEDLDRSINNSLVKMRKLDQY